MKYNKQNNEDIHIELFPNKDKRENLASITKFNNNNKSK